MYIEVPISVFCFTLGYIGGIVSTILFGNYLVRKQERDARERSRKAMQKLIDSKKDKD